MKRAAALLASLAVVAVTWAGCSQQSTTVPVRSLERSGQVAFVCLGDPTSPSPGQPIEACFTPPNPFPTNNYAAPHALALVTQTARGEVAVIDVTAQTVLDANPAIPGFNFLPVGANPTDIVATPGGNATFVAIGDGLRPGIFAIPSSRLPVPVAGRPFNQAPTLASWPACSLDSVPTELVVVSDHAAAQSGRCDASMPAATPTAGLDLSGEAVAYGRLKIVATLPDLGQLVVIDAQELLLREPGSFDPCPIDRTLALDGSASVVSDAGVSSTDGGASSSGDAADAGSDVDPATCSGRVTSSPVPSSMPHPVSMALSDDGRLFVSDDRASVIHVVDVADPCAIAERAPLLPFSAADPTRAVVSGAIAVSPLTSDMKRFVYAVDERVSNTVMVFDVSEGSTERRPLLRTDRLFNPVEPPDRVLFASPVQGLAFATNEAPLGNPGAMGQVPRGVKCKPDLPANATDDLSFPYRPVDFSQGAGPRRLRGTFAFAALTNGRVSVIDVDDFDALCRRPSASDDIALGCQTPGVMLPLPSASGEASCRTVERHRPRSGFFFANATNAGRHAPAMPTFPLLFDDLGTLLPTDPMRPESQSQPKLLGPSLVDKPLETKKLLASVAGSDAVPDDAASTVLSSDPTKATRNWVAFDLREPRAHVEQTWTVTFEGVLTAFEVLREARMVCAAPNNVTECEGGPNPSNFVLQDFNIGFCDAGAQGKTLATTLGLPSGDIVQVTEPLPDPADPYWATVAGVCSPATCEALYGTPGDPRPPRDFPISASFQDRLVLEPNPVRGSSAAPFDCCFPYPFSYVVRAGQQWLVRGSSTFAPHHIIPDPTQANPSTAACIVSCDPLLKLRNSRAVALPFTTPVPPFNAPGSEDPPEGKGVFQNAQIRFVLWAPQKPATIKRGSFFSFVEAGGFAPLEVPLVAGNTAVLAQSIQYIRGINQLAIPDAVSQGLMLFDLNVLSTNGVKPLF